MTTFSQYLFSTYKNPSEEKKHDIWCNLFRSNAKTIGETLAAFVDPNKMWVSIEDHSIEFKVMYTHTSKQVANGFKAEKARLLSSEGIKMFDVSLQDAIDAVNTTKKTKGMDEIATALHSNEDF